MKAPTRIETERLVLRPPAAADADAIFRRFASDPTVTRYLSWPTHRSLAHTRAFLEWSDEQWRNWPAGPYLIFPRDDSRLFGSTGLAFDTAAQAATGYALAADAWGQGYATEALRAMTDLAAAVGVRRLYALCHTDHAASRRVLEKCGFEREGTLRAHTEFPNLSPGELSDVFCYSRRFNSQTSADRPADV